MDDKKVPKSSIIFYCEKCDYKSNKKSQWERHIQTKKHNDDKVMSQKVPICDCGREFKYRQNYYRHKIKCKFNENSNDKKNGNFMVTNDNFEKCPFLCECGKLYKYKTGLSRHKQNCFYNNELANKKQNETLTNLIVKVLEKNTEILDEVKEMAKEPKIINNNTQFNIMNYLNNDCKDAMNLSDFINELPFSLNDLEIMGTQGYQQSIEDTFIKQLTIMDKTKRPIHCSDKKRKSFYIKENDIWEKDDDNTKIVNGFKKLSQKHLNILTSWTHYNKNWSFNERKQNFFNRSVQEVAKYNDSKQINKLICKLTGLTIK
jgi:hypothetical protein